MAGTITMLDVAPSMSLPVDWVLDYVDNIFRER